MNKDQRAALDANLAQLKKEGRGPRKPRISAFDVTREQLDLFEIGRRYWGGKGIARFIIMCVLDWVKRNVK